MLKQREKREQHLEEARKKDSSHLSEKEWKKNPWRGMRNIPCFKLRSVAQCLRSLHLCNAKALLAAVLQPAFSLKLCNVSPRLLWQWFSLVLLMLLFLLFSRPYSCKPQQYCSGRFSWKQTVSSIRITFSPSLFLPSGCSFWVTLWGPNNMWVCSLSKT